jgi:hypothetical protein
MKNERWKKMKYESGLFGVFGLKRFRTAPHFSSCIFLLSFFIFHLSFTTAWAQQRFHKEMPAGNYSGICPLGDNRYAVVSDKSADDGFFVFHIAIDSVRQRITSLTNEGYRTSGLPNRDMEAICYRPSSCTLFIAGERDNEVYEYALDGQRTGRRLQMPDYIRKASHNYGIEALCYDSIAHRFFLTTERPLSGDSLLRIQAFNDDLQPAGGFFYKPDAPISRKYFHGVSELCALADGRLLVLERQLRVPRLKVGAKSVVRVYEVVPEGPENPENPEIPETPETPEPPDNPAAPDGHIIAASSKVLAEKRLLLEFRTRLTLTSRKFANYEGLCQPQPGLLLLVADSQNRYKGILRDWLKVLMIDN